MAKLEEIVFVDRLDVNLEYGTVGVRTRTDILRDGVMIEGASTYHRRVIMPTDEIKDEDDKIAAIVKLARKDAKPLPVPEEDGEAASHSRLPKGAQRALERAMSGAAAAEGAAN